MKTKLTSKAALAATVLSLACPSSAQITLEVGEADFFDPFPLSPDDEFFFPPDGGPLPPPDGGPLPPPDGGPLPPPDGGPLPPPDGGPCECDCGCGGPPHPTEADCVLIIDEDTIDNDMFSIEQRANALGVESDVLINDDNPVEVGNPWLTWNTLFPGDVVVLPGGQVKDEGLFALPGNLPFSLTDFLEGTVPQSQLDKIDGVMPLRNPDLASLIGRTCVAVVYDSDISINYEPINANLQGARYGRFAFTVIDVIIPGTLPESGSDTSLYDLLVRVEPELPVTGNDFSVTIRDHEPDALEIVTATWNDGVVTVIGESDLAPDASMTFSIEGYLREAPMTYIGGDRYRFVGESLDDLSGRRVTISTEEGGAYNDVVD